jgi:hypothetical protein
MTIPQSDLGFIEQCYRSAVRSVLDVYSENGDSPQAPPGLKDRSPPLLAEAMERLLDILHRRQPDGDPRFPATASESMESLDITDLGDYGIRLLADLAEWARVQGLAKPHRELRNGLFALALWVVRRGGELSTLEPVVDTLAFLANSIRTPADLELLFLAATDIMESVNPAIAQDSDRSNPGRPWRVLLQNRAIIATRSHQPALMEQAFATLVEMLPEDAPAFFREGMEQMDALNYPQHVRKVMESYCEVWCSPRTLH